MDGNARKFWGSPVLYPGPQAETERTLCRQPPRIQPMAERNTGEVPRRAFTVRVKELKPGLAVWVSEAAVRGRDGNTPIPSRTPRGGFQSTRIWEPVKNPWHTQALHTLLTF